MQCVMEVGCSWGRTRLVKHDLRTCYTLYYMCLITNRHNPREWKLYCKVDAIGEQQLKWM